MSSTNDANVRNSSPSSHVNIREDYSTEPSNNYSIFIWQIKEANWNRSTKTVQN